MLDLIQNEQLGINETGFTDKRKPKEERKYVCHGDEENR